jgi:hypothetical protein
MTMIFIPQRQCPGSAMDYASVVSPEETIQTIVGMRDTAQGLHVEGRMNPRYKAAFDLALETDETHALIALLGFKADVVATYAVGLDTFLVRCEDAIIADPRGPHVDALHRGVALALAGLGRRATRLRVRPASYTKKDAA